jgi:hypothetical protein
MRNLRHVALTTLALALLAPPVLAQQPQPPMQDAWYWGGQAGVLVYQSIDPTSGTVRASTATLTFGGHWLITRRKVGLYMAFDQVSFDNGTTSAIFNPFAATGVSQVTFTSMQRIQASLFALPMPTAPIQPYGGLGFALHNVTNAAAVLGGTATQSEFNYANENLPELASKAFAVMTAGLAIRTGRMSWFGTYQYMPAGDNFLLVNAQHSFTGGLRYALSASIEEIGTQK